MVNSSTAILVFSRLPHSEARHKKLTGNEEIDTLLYKHLYSHTVSIAKSFFLPTLIYTDNEQVGCSFAEKITHAISDVFNKGFQKVIVLGSDCPELKRKHIAAAYGKLSGGSKIVAGPDKRGGVFLLGVDKSAFDRRKFLSFNWQTNSLLTELRDYASSFSFACIPSVLQDIHTCRDAQLSASVYFSIKSWAKLVASIFSKSHYYYHFKFRFFKSNLPINNLALRAPPLFMASY